MGYKITAGGAQASIAVGNDGIGTAEFSGLLLPGNLPAIGASTLDAFSQVGANGAIYRVESSVVCCAPPQQIYYERLAKPLRSIPVAFVVNAAQDELYKAMVRQAAFNGLLRAVFRCPQQASEWAREMAQIELEQARWQENRRAPLAAR